jgi:hypothetical protein
MTKKILGVRVLTAAQLAELLEEARRLGHEEGRALGYCEGSDDAYEEQEARMAAAGLGGDVDADDAPEELRDYCQGSDDAYAALAAALGIGQGRRRLHA